eukprot:IDg10100t1
MLVLSSLTYPLGAALDETPIYLDLTFLMVCVLQSHALHVALPPLQPLPTAFSHYNVVQRHILKVYYTLPGSSSKDLLSYMSAKLANRASLHHGLEKY